MKIVSLCGSGGCCPAVKIADEHVEIGEKDNLCVLTKSEWETLIEEKGYAEPAVFILHHNGTVAYASLQSGPLGRPSNDDPLRIVSRIQLA